MRNRASIVSAQSGKTKQPTTHKGTSGEIAEKKKKEQGETIANERH
jgi:hypothetical protein